MMVNTITDFMSRKTNVLVLMFILYAFIGYALTTLGIGLKHQTFILFCVTMISFLNHLLGVSKGIFIATLHKKEIDDFIKRMDDVEVMPTMEELIEDIENKYSNNKDNKNNKEDKDD